MCIGRLANYSEELADSVVSNDVLTQLVSNLSSENKYYKKAAASALRGVARHSENHAKYVISANGLSGLIACMQGSDNSVRESAASALGYIARHSEEFARKAVDGGVLPLMLESMKSGDLAAKRATISALSEIGKHSESLASVLTDFLPILIQDMDHTSDAGIRKNALLCLDNMCKNSMHISDSVLKAGLFPRILPLLKDPVEQVRKNACMLLRDISKHSLDLSKEIMTAGGIAGIMEYLKISSGLSKVPAIVSLGYMASYSETLAQGIINSGLVPILIHDLISEPDEAVKSAISWTLGQIGRHTSEHSRILCEQDGLRKLLAVFMAPESSADLKAKAKASLKAIIAQCTITPALEPMLAISPIKIQKALLRQFAKILPSDIPSKKSFIQSGCLKLMQEIPTEPGTKIRQFIADINALYPPEIVNFYSPQYPEVLLKKLEEYSVKHAQKPVQQAPPTTK